MIERPGEAGKERGRGRPDWGVRSDGQSEHPADQRRPADHAVEQVVTAACTVFVCQTGGRGRWLVSNGCGGGRRADLRTRASRHGEDVEMTKELYELGDMPPLGEIPERMHAWLIRPERFGPPMQAFQQEVVEVPAIADDEVLVYVMAAGINYNNVWAGLGVPVDVIGARNKAGRDRDRSPSTSAAATPPASSTRSARTSPTSRSATRSSSTAAAGTATTPGSRAAAIPCTRRPSASGATRPTGAASPSSPRSRATSACRSPRT